jgi:hypothetical protein
MNAKSLLMLTAAATLAFTGCATKREFSFRITPTAADTGVRAKHDYATYAKIPDGTTSLICRAVLKSIPYTRERAFRGNYAGSGNVGGLPVDEMDAIYRIHDIVYVEAGAAKTMRWADDACIEALAKIDTRRLTAADIEYRDRAAAFFKSKAFGWMGKPPVAFLHAREAKDCPFQTEDDVRRAFGLAPKQSAVTVASIASIELPAKAARRSR